MEVKMIVDNIKKDIKAELIGKMLVREDKSYPGLNKAGQRMFNIYYNTPTNYNKDLIKKVVEYHGGLFQTHRIIGGNYGYVASFRVLEPK